MIIYGSSISPYVRKTLVFAAEKGLAVENTPTSPGAEEPLFREASPFGKIPAFRDDDFTLCDSSAIVTYLDTLGDAPKLIAEDAKARARMIWWDEFGDTILFDAGRKMFFNRVVGPKFMGLEGDLAVADRAERKELPPILDFLEESVGDGYLVGDSFSLADIAVASPCVNLLHLGIAFDPARHPKLAAYVGRIISRPSFAGIVQREKSFLARFDVISVA